MKILKIIVENLPRFNKKCEIDFLPQQKVGIDDIENINELFFIGSKIFYENNVVLFTGINASGKTSVLKLIDFVFSMLNNVPINNIASSDILDDMIDTVTFDTFFFSKNKNNETVNLLNTVIVREDGKLKIISETLKTKDICQIKEKKIFYNFSNIEPNLVRDTNSDFLLDDVSIMIAFNKRNQEAIKYKNMFNCVNNNELNIFENCPPELISFFDPTIEYLKLDGLDIHLKFKSKKEITLNQLSELNHYLSSGTIRGINAFSYAISMFNEGGYLIVDDLEKHLNSEIISILIRFFMNKKINKKGATIIFSTHYSELLDEFERDDNIYIVRNHNEISVENLSKISKVGNVTKSEAYKSGLLGGTVPAYDAYMKLKNVIIYDTYAK